MSYDCYKRTAIHNLRITQAGPGDGTVDEGLVLPQSLMELADISPFEQIVVTNIRGTNWDNRIYSFAIPGGEGTVEARGSLARFLIPGDLVCLITRGHMTGEAMARYRRGELPLVDIGFAPDLNFENRLEDAMLMLEYPERKEPATAVPAALLADREEHALRIHLSHLVQGLEVTATHPDCLQGSAEIPHDVMEMAGLTRYQSVFVYNASQGGMAETYVVPMPSGVVMTTGAMAGFAPRGSRTNIAVYRIGRPVEPPRILRVRDNAASASELVLEHAL